MWQAVIAAAVSDALNSRIPEADRQDALDWLFAEDGCFEFVCDMANVSPEEVKKEFLRKTLDKNTN